MANEWLAAYEVAQLMHKAQIAETDWTYRMAWACVSGRVLGTGFGRVHVDSEVHRNVERDFVPNRVWRVLQRADPRYPLERPEGRESYDLHSNWARGEFGYVFQADSGILTQETWTSVHFDRTAVLSLFQAPRRAGGRPAIYDWSAHKIEAVAQITRYGGIGPDYSQAQCERDMLVWCQQFFGREPSESMNRKHVKLAIESMACEAEN